MVFCVFSNLEFRRLTENFKKIFDIKTKENTEVIQEKQPETDSIIAGSGQFSLFDQVKEKTDKNSSIRISKKEISHLFQIVDTKISLNIFLDKLMKQTSVAFKLLLDNHNPLLSNLVGISFCWSKNKVYYIDYLEIQKTDKKILQKIKLFFEDHSIEKISQNEPTT